MAGRWSRLKGHAKNAGKLGLAAAATGVAATAAWAQRSPSTAGPRTGVRNENVGTFAVAAIIVFLIDFIVYQFNRGSAFLLVTFVMYGMLAVLAYILLKPEEEQGGLLWGTLYIAILSVILGGVHQGFGFLPIPFGFPLFVIYIGLSIGILSAIAPKNTSHFFIWCLRKSFFAWALPAVIAIINSDLSLLSQYIYDAGVALGVSLFVSMFISGYLKHFIVYFAGWAGWAVDHMAATGSRFWSILRKVILFAYIMMLIVPLTSTIHQTQVAALAGPDYQFEAPPTFFEMTKNTWTMITEFWEFLKDPTQPLPGATKQGVDQTTAAIRDTVVYNENRDLGVVIVSQFPLKTPYFIGVQVDDETRTLIPWQDRSIAWTGELRAQTFAQDMKVQLSCLYDRPAENGDLSGDEDAIGTARPAEWIVRRTGETVDVFGFECKIPIDNMLERDGAPATVLDLNGQFKTRARFRTESWGFTEVTFMDSAQHRALRSANINPATELEIFPTTRPMSVPGPVGIGVLDRVTQPIPVDVTNKDTLFLPSFGVTLNNRWIGRGKFITDDRNLLIINVSIPEPFELDVPYAVSLNVRNLVNAPVLDNSTKELIRDKCIGLPDFRTLLKQKDVLRPSYTNYIFVGLEYDSERDREITIRCPFNTKDMDIEDLLGPANSPKLFTFTAQANFTYEIESNALVSLSLKEDGEP